MERLAWDKHSSLLEKSLNCGCNKFYDTGPRNTVETDTNRGQGQRERRKKESYFNDNSNEPNVA